MYIDVFFFGFFFFLVTVAYCAALLRLLKWNWWMCGIIIIIPVNIYKYHGQSKVVDFIGNSLLAWPFYNQIPLIENPYTKPCNKITIHMCIDTSASLLNDVRDCCNTLSYFSGFFYRLFIKLLKKKTESFSHLYVILNLLNLLD